MNKKCRALFCFILGLSSVSFAGLLKTGLPLEQLLETPNPNWDKGLENLYNGKIKWSQMPEEVNNLAKNKKITSSDDFPLLGEVNFINDGEKETGEGGYVEPGPSIQWIQFDLEKQSKIYAIILWYYHGSERAYHDVIAQISNDPEFKKGVTTVFNNDYDNSSKLGKGQDKVYKETFQGWPIAVSGKEGQNVRLYSNGSISGEMNHYVEVEVFGR
ncbi:MAG: discoidin domain-containing protein [Verrucomicrobiota bacterium]